MRPKNIFMYLFYIVSQCTTNTDKMHEETHVRLLVRAFWSARGAGGWQWCGGSRRVEWGCWWLKTRGWGLKTGACGRKRVLVGGHECRRVEMGAVESIRGAGCSRRVLVARYGVPVGRKGVLVLQTGGCESKRVLVGRKRVLVSREGCW